MNGHGLRYFEPFFSERGLIGTEVKVYKANWQGNGTHIEQNYVDLLDQIENSTMLAFAAEIEVQPSDEGNRDSTTNTSEA